MKKFIELIKNLFKHDCNNHKKCIAVDISKNNQFGIASVSITYEYECTKCGKKWYE